MQHLQLQIISIYRKIFLSKHLAQPCAAIRKNSWKETWRDMPKCAGVFWTAIWETNKRILKTDKRKSLVELRQIKRNPYKCDSNSLARHFVQPFRREVKRRIHKGLATSALELLNPQSSVIESWIVWLVQSQHRVSGERQNSRNWRTSINPQTPQSGSQCLDARSHNLLP